MSDRIILIEHDTLIVETGFQGPPGPQGPQGPQGAPGVGVISTDPDNAIVVGSDGGAYCPAVVTGTTHW